MEFLGLPRLNEDPFRLWRGLRFQQINLRFQFPDFLTPFIRFRLAFLRAALKQFAGLALGFGLGFRRFPRLPFRFNINQRSLLRFRVFVGEQFESSAD